MKQLMNRLHFTYRHTIRSGRLGITVAWEMAKQVYPSN